MSFPWAKPYEPKQPLMKWLDEKLPLPRLVYNATGRRLSGAAQPQLFLELRRPCRRRAAIQIITGIVLAMHYAANVGVAFNSVEQHHARRQRRLVPALCAHERRVDVLHRRLLHIFRGLYYGSYKAPREMVWLLGVVIFLLMMATAFMGYVLPWGQMSFWGAQVITGFFSAIPIVGERSASGCSAASRPTMRRSTASSRCTICCRS
jgi:ubiquinol-cytochrome c reductase cytochrome b subunit